jgi:uncharacterized protein
MDMVIIRSFECVIEFKFVPLAGRRARRTGTHFQEKTAMRADMLNSLLSQLNSSSTDIEASAIISVDGLIIASMLPAGMDEDRVGAMSAAMLSLGDRTSQELARGSMEQVLVKGDKGYVLMTYAGDNAVLTVLTKPSAKLGLVFLDVKRTAAEVAKMVG